MIVTADRVRAELQAVHDPEIPAVSIVDLGMVGAIEVDTTGVRVQLMPTFIGCPAQGIIQETAEECLRVAFPTLAVRVEMTLQEAWSTRRITAEGRSALIRSGIAPPGETLEAVACPFCGEAEAVMENLFASTSCRSLFYCRRCHNPFEAFKPL